MIDNSCVGQKMIAAGTQANGGIGRSTSNTGNTIPYKVRLTAMLSPSGMPSSMAAKKPANTRRVLKYQLNQ